MKILKTICLLQLLPLFWGCAKEGGGCFARYGDTATETRGLEGFDRVYLGGRMDVEYRYDTAYRAEVRYGDGLMDQIKTEVTDGTLRVDNETGCNALRDPGRWPKVTLYAPRFAYLENKLTGDLTFRDTLRTSVFWYEQWESNGEIELLLDTDTARVYAHVGYTHIVATGRTHVAELYTGSSGTVDAAGLIADVTLSNNSSIQDLKVYAGEYLYGFIGRRGDIRYAGAPQTVDVAIEGSGTVAPL